MITIFEVGQEQREHWDSAIGSFDIAHPLNSFGWGKVRAIDGWSPAYYLAKRENTITGGIMVLTKRLPLVDGSIMYAQRGPVWNFDDRETLKALIDRVREDAREKKAAFLRIDPHLPLGAFALRKDPFVEAGFIPLNNRWSYWNSPSDVFRIDLTKARTIEELYNTLDPDAKRCIRKATKDGIILKSADTTDEVKTFFAIYKDFSSQKGFMSRGYEYQKALWDEFICRGNGRLFLILNQGKIIGGLIGLTFARKCLNMHMCSLYEYRRLQPNDAVVWESIKWAKETGCLWYSFRGVGSTPSQEKFKQKYGPQVVSLVGYYDLPLRPMFYHIFRTAESQLLPKVYSAFTRLRGMKFASHSAGFGAS